MQPQLHMAKRDLARAARLATVYLEHIIQQLPILQTQPEMPITVVIWPRP